MSRVKGTLIGLHIHLLTFTCGTSVLPRFPQNNLHLSSYLPPLLATHTHTPPQLLHLTLESPMTWLTSHVGIKCTRWGALAPSSREREVEATAAQSHATRNVLYCSGFFFYFCLPDTNLDWSQYPPTLEDEEGAHSLIRSVVRSVIHTHARALAFFAPLSNTNTNTKHWCKML